MIQNQIPIALLLAGAIAAIAAQPATAETRVSAVRLNATEGGFELILETQSGDRPTESRPQIFVVDRNGTWVADIVNASLDLPENDFRQDNPAPGIASVVVGRLDANSIRITVTGDSAAPSGQLLERDDQRLTFAIQPAPEDQAASLAAPTAQSPDAPERQLPLPSLSDVLEPNPEVTISGDATPSGAPAFLPRAIAPPVGDIAVAATDASADTIDLGSSEVIPRLVLREAPVRDVLALLARAAGLNLAYDEPETEGISEAALAETTGPAISIDIENEPVEDVFNYVLQLSGLEANRRGRTIFVGTRLPRAARNSVIRSLRINQVTVGVALNFLVGMGAESAVSRERLVTSVNAVAVQLPEDVATTPVTTQTQTTTEERLETQRVDYQDNDPPLRGLLVLGDERTNTITLIGSPRQVEIAASQISQIDVRRLQATVNVKIVDVNLSALDEANASFAFGINDSFFRFSDEGFSADFNDFSEDNDSSGFQALIEAQVTNGNAKILTDPTLIVQEGQTATVALTEEVQTTTGTTTFDDDGNVVSFDQDDPRAAGLTLAIEIQRIDDNGFITLSVAPTVTAPSSQQTNPDDSVTTLLSSRTLQSGQIRLRDGQTLILSGIIQENDRTDVSKVPILGDIPILGALFRQSRRQNERQEVIVVLTPRIIDDSESSSLGYTYIPGREVQQLLRDRR